MDYFFLMKHQGLEKPEMMENMQRWYLTDANQAIQDEFENLLDKWNERQAE